MSRQSVRFALILSLATLVAAMLVYVCLPSTAAADEKYAERQVFDPKTGQWTTVAPPIAGTEDGDLELARSLQARGEYDAARKAFKSWFKTHGDSARRPEALFYAADTEVSSEEAKANSGDLMQAYRWYEELLEGWAGTELADRAIRRELIIAEMFLFKDKKQKVFKGMFRVSATDEALTMLDRIINEWAPNTPIAEQALRLKADYHYNNGEFQEAEQAYAKLARDFGRGKYHRFAMLRSGESALARFPGVEFDEADLLESEVYLTDFQAKYPKYAGEADVPAKLERIKDSKAHKDYNVGQFYERTGKKNAAIYYYRHVEKTYPSTTWANLSHNRLESLGALNAPIEATPLNAPTSTAPAEPLATPAAAALPAGATSGGASGTTPTPMSESSTTPPAPAQPEPAAKPATPPPPPEPLEPLPPK